MKLALLEKRLAELELRNKATPLTAAALALNEVAEKSQADADAKSTTGEKKDIKASTSHGRLGLAAFTSHLIITLAYRKKVRHRE